MKIFQINEENTRLRKEGIVKTLSEAHGADLVLPMSGRVLIADLVMAGVGKILETLTLQMEQASVVLEGPAMEGLFIALCQEASGVFADIVAQRQEFHLKKLLEDVDEHEEYIAPMLEKLRAAGVDVMSLDELKAKFGV